MPGRGAGRLVKHNAKPIKVVRPNIGRLEFDRPLIMGVVNVTPDSFSDGGSFLNPADAIAHGLLLVEQGADILDIGGESTRPGALPVSVEIEESRVLPVVEGLSEAGVPVSIDSRHARVMEKALLAGADIINDISALEYEKESMAVAALADGAVVLMHSRDTPQNMQNDPQYGDVVSEVYAYFEKRIEACSKAGIDSARLVLDPGIGFGKSIEHNLALLAHLDRFHQLGCPLMVGISRKSFIGHITGAKSPQDRLPGSISGAMAALMRGVHILRVHDVADTCQAVQIWQAIVCASGNIGSGRDND